jgi:hypothetical protein
MTDVGEPEGDDGASPGEGPGITEFLTSARGIITAVATLIIAVSGLITALRATGLLGGDSDDEPTPGLFTAGPVRGGHVSVEGRSVVVTSSRAGQPVVHLANLEGDRVNVSLSARIKRSSGTDDYGAGFVCRHRNALNYYALSVLSGGRYRILKYRKGKNVAVLSKGDRVAAIRDGANDVTASCLGDDKATLTLSVNGLTVGQATDRDPIRSGGAGIRVGTNTPPVTCRFDLLDLS